MLSVNNKVICRPYIGKAGIETTVSKGLASASQKSRVVGVEILVDGKLPNGDAFKAGQKAYFSESDFKIYEQLRMVKTCDDVSGDFIIVPGELIVCIK